MRASGILIRLSLLAVLLALAPGAAGTRAIATPPAINQSPSVAMHEVRLRKLHLVRPDLIPYPLDYEVVC